MLAPQTIELLTHWAGLRLVRHAGIRGHGLRRAAPARRLHHCTVVQPSEATSTAVGTGYTRRAPEKTLLYRVPAPAPDAPGHPGRPRRTLWAGLLRRVYALDLFACPHCSGRMRIIAAITQTTVIRAILRACGLPAAPPARPPPPPGPAPNGDKMNAPQMPPGQSWNI